MAKPWPVASSTTAPWALTPGMSPTWAKVSRLKTPMWPRRPAGAGDVEIAVGGIRGDVVESALAAANLDGLKDLVGAGLGERGDGKREGEGGD